MFLYVHLNSDDFQMFFSSEKMRQRFYDLILEMTDQIDITDFDADSEPVAIQVCGCLEVLLKR